MARYLLAATAICLVAHAPLANAQGAQDSTSRQQNEAPVSVQERPPQPKNPLPQSDAPPDVRDYQTPSEAGKAVVPGASPAPPVTIPGAPVTPPGAVETPSMPPASSQPTTSPRDVEPSAGAALPLGYIALDKYLAQEGIKRSYIIGKPVVLPNGQQVGTLAQLVTRNGQRYAHLTLPETPYDRERDVVASLERLFLAPDGDRVRIDAGSRQELQDLPEYMPESYQTVR